LLVRLGTISGSRGLMPSDASQRNIMIFMRAR
jgi:hypothetical protein